jgi:hypothetical protein
MKRLLRPRRRTARVQSALAALVTDPNDPRTWQGATVGNLRAALLRRGHPRQPAAVVDNHLLDDGLFSLTVSSPGPLITSIGQYANQGGGKSLDTAPDRKHG